MKIFIAGSNTCGSEGLTKKYGLSKLYSMLSEKNDIRGWNDETLLMVDSGAHSWNKTNITKGGMKERVSLPSAKYFLDTYVLFIKCHAKKRVIYVEFDVYGNLSYEYITEAYDKIRSTDGNFKIMRVYHPVLDNGTYKILNEWIEQGQDYIGIGNDSIGHLDNIFKITTDKIKVHGFAMTKLNLLEKYPFFSVDSTTPISTVIFGNYTSEYLAMKDRTKVIEERSIEIFQGDEERLENAIINVKKTEDYLTKLWTKRGITWKPLF